jgi:hypothetical protein
MVMTKSQANPAIGDGTNNQATMASVEETEELEHPSTGEKTAEEYIKLGKDGKRKRIVSGLVESPNR